MTVLETAMRDAVEREAGLPQQCDVLVIGGGPAGSAISAMLAEKGWRVRIVEKDPHPRFHIGESLLPHSLPLLERLGVLQEIEKIGMRKYGFEVFSPEHADPVVSYFSQAKDASIHHAYHVRRSEFDQILLENAAGKGAIVHEGWRVTHVQFRNEAPPLITAVDRHDNTRAWEASFVVDATGRDSFLSTRLGGKRRDTHLNSAAIFSHFEGVQRHTGLDEGNISIYWFDHGWIWIIPFKDGITSIGAVCWPAYLKSRKSSLDQFLWETLAHCRPVAERLKGAKLVMPAMATGNYSYRSTKQIVGARHLMIGDALGFIDPVFSTGVHLALLSAMLGADVVEARLTDSPDFIKRGNEFQRTMRRSLDIYTWFIYRFTQPAFRIIVMSPRRIVRIQRALVSLFSGDVFGTTSIRLPIFFFKVFYYLHALVYAKSNLKAYAQRVHAVNDGAGSNCAES